MTESRQERRRALKKKMQPIRVVTQKGGQQVQVLKSSEYERIDRIREDPAFPAFRAAYELVRDRPPVLGCDPMDPWNIPQTLHFATGTVSVDGVPVAEAKDIEITLDDRSRIDKPEGDIKKCPKCGRDLVPDSDYPNDLLCGTCCQVFDATTLEFIEAF